MKKILISAIAFSVLEEGSTFLFLPGMLGGGGGGGLLGGMSGGGGGLFGGKTHSAGCKSYKNSRGGQSGQKSYQLQYQSPSPNVNINLNQNRRIDFSIDTPSILQQNGNYLINGNFNFPPLNTQYEFTTLQGWRADEIQRGLGTVYNMRWGRTVVVQLDGNQNNRMSQSVNLNPGNYVLSFRWAARSGYVQSAGMTILWNNKVIFQARPRDEQIYTQQIPINIIKAGNYVLQIRGTAQSDTYGLTIANFKLTGGRGGQIRNNTRPKPKPIPNPDDISWQDSIQWEDEKQTRPKPKPKPKPQPKPVIDQQYTQQFQFEKPAPKPVPKPVPKPAPKPTPKPIPLPIPNDQTSSTAYTLVSSETFSMTKSKYFTFWQVRGFVKFPGNKFNSIWDGNCLATSSNNDDIIRQKTFLDIGVYKFQFDHVAKNGSTKPEKFIVFLNDKKIGTAQPTAEKVKTFGAKFNVSKPGSFRFQIRVQRSPGSERIALANPRLTLVTGQSTKKESSSKTLTFELNNKKIPIVGGKSGINVNGKKKISIQSYPQDIENEDQPDEFIDQEINWDINPNMQIKKSKTTIKTTKIKTNDISTGSTMNAQGETSQNSVQNQDDQQPEFEIEEIGTDS